MEASDYEYRGLKAMSWDLFRGDTSDWPDRSFYLEVIRESGQPVLDVGCGTGRLLLDYLAQGIDIDGVDLSPEMLMLCREKAARLGFEPTLYQQSMEALELPRIFRTILVPSSSFQLLTDPSAAVGAMSRFFRHLQPGGTLAMPFMLLYTKPATETIVVEDWHLAAQKKRPEDGSVVRLWSKNTFDLEQKLEYAEDRYDVVQDGTVIAEERITRSPSCRWYSQEEAIDLYREAGFTQIRAFSGFTMEPACPEDTIFTVLGTRP